jgi:acetyl-CoA carboxylase carboxyl transferase subunit alpha
MLFEDFFEVHGDRAFADDQAMLTGFARLEGERVLVVGHRKGKTTREKIACNFGCAHPEGYRKALGKMKIAAKFGLPILALIDTPGAYPGVGAEERGQAHAIALNILEMSRLPTPIVCVVTGEGGSGGALGIGVGDIVAVLEHAYYSVISPEGCAAILWKSGDMAARAASALRLTARDLLRFGIIDEVIPEPLGGAHRDNARMGEILKGKLLEYLGRLKSVPIQELLERRYRKFRGM